VGDRTPGAEHFQGAHTISEPDSQTCVVYRVLTPQGTQLRGEESESLPWAPLSQKRLPILGAQRTLGKKGLPCQDQEDPRTEAIKPLAKAVRDRGGPKPVTADPLPPPRLEASQGHCTHLPTLGLGSRGLPGPPRPNPLASEFGICLV
jgi:hypothetical protein